MNRGGGRGRFYVKGRGEDGAMRGVMWGRLTRRSPVVLVSAVVQHLHAARSPQRVQEDVV